jgi:hypothetical protein
MACHGGVQRRFVIRYMLCRLVLPSPDRVAQAEAWHVNGAHVVAAGDSSAAVTSGRERRPDARDCSPRFHSFSNFHNVSESGLSACFPSPPVTHPIRRGTTLPIRKHAFPVTCESPWPARPRPRAPRLWQGSVCEDRHSRLAQFANDSLFSPASISLFVHVPVGCAEREHEERRVDAIRRPRVQMTGSAA